MSPRREGGRVGVPSLALGFSLALLAGAVAAGPAAPSEREAAPRCAEHDPLRRPFFGDLHVHTAFSLDAAADGTPRSAYDAARRLSRPLDFAAVTDHAEWLGEVGTCIDPKRPGYGSDLCWAYRAQRGVTVDLIAQRTVRERSRFEFCGPDAALCREATRGLWREIRAAAEAAYDRSPACRFTTFVGYEWTGSLGAGINLHRNVLFASDEVPDEPASFLDTGSVAVLWRRLTEECLASRRRDCDVLTIPHNSNLSDGLMFTSAKLERPDQRDLPIDADEARLRQRLEPLVEIMQHKGDSECLLGGETRDEACAFEKVPYNSFAGASTGPEAWAEMPPRRSDTVREALKKGLALEARIGVNPFRYGVLASTDTHTARPGSVEESSYSGHTLWGRRAGAEGLPDALHYNPGGLAGVFAEENSRASLFAALKRREVFGTSGPRIVARSFGGWDYPADLCAAPDAVARADAGGVAMGSVLAGAGSGRSKGPVLAIFALQDPGTPGAPGSPLRSVEIVKGRLSPDGALHETVYRVATAPGEATVDPATCETKGTGRASFCRVWRDPDFDPREPAFYYARVLENPTCRWSQRRCVEAKVDCTQPDSVAPGFAGCCEARHQPVIQERAWTSPIWYAP
ncbi:MAG: DUF3604 domain-containing protein [Myxococcota bacterium]